MDKHFIKRKPKEEESILFQTIKEGYSMYLGDFTIESTDGCIGYMSNKEIVARHSYDNKLTRGFMTVKGAMEYIENNS